jgi:hypothetical protein
MKQFALPKKKENKRKGPTKKAQGNKTRTPPKKASVDHIMHLQQTIGNQAVQRMIKSGTLRLKDKSPRPQPGDIYTREVGQLMQRVENVGTRRQAYALPHVIQAKWIDADNLYKWDTLIDGVRWYAIKDTGKMFFIIENESEIKEGSLEDYQILQGVKNNRTWIEWNSISIRPHEPRMDESRVSVLQKIKKTIGDQSGSRLLYLGAGSDIVNPFLSTGAGEYVFVSKDKYNMPAIVEEIQRLVIGARIMSQEIHKKLNVLKIYSGSSKFLFTVKLYQCTYEEYFKDFATGEGVFDILFDKESWLQEDVKSWSAYLTSLKERGILISDFAYGYGVSDIIPAIFGMRDVTRYLGEVAQIGYGHGSANLYIKQTMLDNKYMNAALHHYNELKSILRMAKHGGEVDESYLRNIGEVLESNFGAIIELLSKTSLAKTGLIENVKRLKKGIIKRIQSMLVKEEEPEEKEPPIEKIITKQGIHIIHLFDGISQENVRSLQPDDNVQYTHKSNKSKYVLKKIEGTGNWAMKVYTFQLVG